MKNFLKAILILIVVSSIPFISNGIMVRDYALVFASTIIAMLSLLSIGLISYADNYMNKQINKTIEEYAKTNNCGYPEIRKQFIKSILQISEAHIEEYPDVVLNEITFHLTWQNKSNKTIKYISFKAIPYNSVNDVVNSEYEKTFVGPANPGSEFKANFNPHWFSHIIARIALTEIKIEYTDDTIVYISKDEIPLIKC